MFDVSTEYLSAMSDQNTIHHICGTIAIGAETIDISADDSIIGEPVITRQCTRSADNFGIGELYTGTARISVELPDIRRDDLKGGTLRLWFRAGNTEEIPLGVWTITDPRRDSSGHISITAEDCISALDVPITDPFVGAITIEARLFKVTELTGVEFAQTPEEIYELIGGNSIYFGSTYCASCREEVAAIAELLGGFACADRYGRIVFRRFGKVPVKTISANMRHSITLGEYTFGIRGLVYEIYNHQTIVPIGAEDEKPNTSAILRIPRIPYIKPIPDLEWLDIRVSEALEPAAEHLHLPVWSPGKVDYYGDPALDLGDMVEIEGGINGTENTLFLITADTWKFRGAHTLISAGAVENTQNSTTSTAPALTKTQAQIVNLNVTKSIETVTLKTYLGMLSRELREVAAAGYSAREATTIFAEINAIFDTSEPSEITLNVLADGVRQTVQGMEKGGGRNTLTISLTADISASAGSHKVTVEACGNGELTKLNALIWGQGITAEQPEPTTAGDYRYRSSTGSAEVLKYIGKSRCPAIPDTLGRVPVRIIGDEAFAGSAVEFVYIPDGVEEIL